MNLELIAKLETLAANALACQYSEDFDGWRLRYNSGVTRRANSVLAETSGYMALNAKIDYAETWYSRLGAKARFQISPASQPQQLKDSLLQRGYGLYPGAKIQVAELKHIISQTSTSSVKVSLSSKATKTWLELYESSENASPEKAHIRRQMFDKLSANAAFALASIAGIEAAVGLGVYEAGHIGIFNMATLAKMRRQGAATAILQNLAHWGQKQNAEHLYLQVASENQGAQQFYQSLGFLTLYEYVYLEQKPE